MGVKVSRIDDSTTSWKKKGDRWTDHYHSLDYSSHEVPTIEEHRVLEDKVNDCQQDIVRIKSEIIKGDKRLAEFAVTIPNLSTEVGNVRTRLENTVKALNETGQLATIFKSVTDKHLGDIQKAVNALALKIKDGERKLKEKETESLEQIKKTISEITAKIREAEQAVAALKEATDKLESRLILIEREDALGKLAVLEKKYSETLVACQDTLSAANYFRSVNRSFFSRLWWCLTGRCNEAQ